MAVRRRPPSSAADRCRAWASARTSATSARASARRQGRSVARRTTTSSAWRPVQSATDLPSDRGCEPRPEACGVVGRVTTWSVGKPSADVKTIENLHDSARPRICLEVPCRRFRQGRHCVEKRETCAHEFASFGWHSRFARWRSGAEGTRPSLAPATEARTPAMRPPAMTREPSAAAQGAAAWWTHRSLRASSAGWAAVWRAAWDSAPAVRLGATVVARIA